MEIKSVSSPSGIYDMTLSNGLRVIYLQKPTLQESFIKFDFKYGTDDDSEALYGTAHLLEHLMGGNSGDKKRNEIFKERDNAVTTDSKTFYYTFTANDKIYQVLESYITSLNKPSFSEEIIEAEKDIIAVELSRYIDASPDHDFLKKIFQHHDHDKALETLSNITVSDLSKQHKTYYLPNNCTLLLTGPIYYQDIYDQLNKITEVWKKGVEPSHLLHSFQLPESFCDQSDTLVNDIYYLKKVDVTKLENLLYLKAVQELFDNQDSYFDNLFSKTRLDNPLTYTALPIINFEKGIIGIKAQSLPKNTTALVEALKASICDYSNLARDYDFTKCFDKLKEKFLYDEQNSLIKLETYYSYGCTPMDLLQNLEEGIHNGNCSLTSIQQLLSTELLSNQDWNLYIHGQITEVEAKELSCHIINSGIITENNTFLT